MFKILIAEDDKNLNRLLKKNLEQEGFDVVCSFNGEEALRFLKRKDSTCS